MSKIYQGSNLFVDTTTLSGGGSVTPTILSIDAMYKEFHVTDVGSKNFSITDMLGSGKLVKDVWASSGNLNTGRQQLGATGSQNASLSIGGGWSGSAYDSLYTEKFNGSTWSNSGNLVNAREGCGATGTQIAALVFSGGGGAGYNKPAELFNGATWTNTGSLNTARGNVGSSGIRTATIAISGQVAGGSPYVTNTCELFNGSTWSNIGTVNTAVLAPRGAGTQSSTIKFGGGISTGSASGITETFNGLVWISSGATMNVARWAFGGCGTQSSSIAFGGTSASFLVGLTPTLSSTEKFNGLTWSNSTIQLSSKSGNAGCGSQNNSISFGGTTTGSDYLNTTEKFTGQPLYSTYVVAKNDTDFVEQEFKNNISLQTVGIDSSKFTIVCPAYVSIEIRPLANGITQQEQNDLTTLGIIDDVVGGVWTASGSLNTARHILAGAGLENSGLSFGGDTSGGASPSAVTEKFNGSTWSNSGNLNTARSALSGCGIQTSALSFGGGSVLGSTNTGVTETFNGTAWTTLGASMNIARRALAGCGITSSALSFGGYVSGYVNNTEKFNGSTWSNSATLINTRGDFSGVGTQNAGLSSGGSTDGSNYVGLTEKFNGTAWSSTGSMNVGRYRQGMSGTQNSSLTMGGYAGASTSSTEKFNGSIWSSSGNLNTARFGLAGSGIQNSSLAFGGTTGSASNITEKFNTQITLPVSGQLVNTISYV